MSSVRPRRSVLYMPSSNARALEKAKTLAADGLILDLEDAVAPDAKVEARKMACEAAQSKGYGHREILIRANALSTPWGYDDIAQIAASGADGLVIPKVESADMVLQVEALMRAAGAPDSMRLWCMMETPRGILRAEEIAAASPRIAGLIMGTSDLTKELRCATVVDRLPLQASLAHCLLVARAYGIVALDGVHLDLSDDAGFEAACRQGADMGFDGKTLIHPKTIETANRIFGPTDEEAVHAETIMKAYEAALAEGKGLVVVDGKLIENLHVENARRILELTKAIKDAASI